MKRQFRFDGALKKLLEVSRLHLDANETQVLSRQLEYIYTQVEKAEYPDILYEKFLPIQKIDEWAQTYTWRLYSPSGEAKIITNLSSDLPLVGMIAEEKTHSVVDTGVAFSYDINEILASAKTGIQFDSEKGILAKEASERKFDDIACFGSGTTPGFLNHPNVTVLTSPGDIAGNWLTASSTSVLDDLNKCVAKMWTLSAQKHAPDTLLLPTEHFARLQTLVMGAGDARTVLQAFLAASPWVKNIDAWARLNLADSAGTGPRAVFYRRDPSVAHLVVSKEHTAEPPQAKNLAWMVPCHGRIGGTNVKKPMGILYVEGF